MSITPRTPEQELARLDMAMYRLLQYWASQPRTPIISLSREDTRLMKLQFQVPCAYFLISTTLHLFEFRRQYAPILQVYFYIGPGEDLTYDTHWEPDPEWKLEDYTTGLYDRLIWGLEIKFSNILYHYELPGAFEPSPVRTDPRFRDYSIRFPLHFVTI